jgi:putative flippase GtrA
MATPASEILRSLPGATHGSVRNGGDSTGMTAADPGHPPTGVPPGLGRQLVRFTAVGVTSTVAYLLLYALLRNVTGPQPANFTAMLATALANTALNRRLTFGVRGPQGALRHQVQGLVIFAIGLGMTSGGLAVLDAADPVATRSTELAVLVAANLTATVVRFVLLRAWVFGPGRSVV